MLTLILSILAVTVNANNSDNLDCAAFNMAKSSNGRYCVDVNAQSRDMIEVSLFDRVSQVYQSDWIREEFEF